MPGRRTFLLLSLLATALLSCAELPPIEERLCGNGFIEQGEDCDYFKPPAGQGGTLANKEAICNPPGAANECLWRCEFDEECQKSPVVTPPYPGPFGTSEDAGAKVKDGSGWRCGSDHVCRHPRGAQVDRAFFTPVGNLVPGSADELFAGDFDGDRRKDVLAMGQTGFGVHYFASDGHEAKSIRIPAAPVIPAIGKLTTGPADDFTLDVARGIGVMLGGLDATVDPTTYLSLDIKKRYGNGMADDMRLFILDSGAGPRPMALSTLGDSVELIDAAAPLKDHAKVLIEQTTGLGRKRLFGSIPVSFLKAQGDRQRFLLAYEGEDSVIVVDVNPALYPKATVSRSNIMLPPGSNVHGAAFFQDVNADDFPDVVVGTAQCAMGTNGMTSCPVAELALAYGDGEGAFDALPKSSPSWTIDAEGKASRYIETYPNNAPPPPPPPLPPPPPPPEAEIEQFLPLAIGRINDDGDVDYVNAFGIYVGNSAHALPCNNTPNGYCRAERPSVDGLWSEARIADFNANGHADVVGVSAGLRGIDFFNGSGTGIFNTFFLPTEGAPRSLAVGDFDGDLVTDLAFDSVTQEIDKVAKEGKLKEVHKLFAAFGNLSGPPAPPADMGEVQSLLQLMAGNVSSLGNDAATDLVLLSGNPAKASNDAMGRDWKVGLSLGNGYRQLQAPLVFFRPGSIALRGVPMASAIGLFDDAAAPPASAHADVAAVIMTRKSDKDFDDSLAGSQICDFTAELWLLPATGDANIEPPADSSKWIGIPTRGARAPLLPIRRLVEAVPIDVPGGAKELVIAFPSYKPDTCTKDLATMASHGELYLARFDANGPTTVTQIPISLESRQFLVHLRVGDVDGDGVQDIVALKTTLDLDTIQPLSTSVVMLRGTSEGTFELPIEVPIEALVEVPSEVPDALPVKKLHRGFPIDFALVNADGNSDPEIVVVAELAEAGQGAALFVIDWDRALTDPAKPFKTLLPIFNDSSVLEGSKAIAGGDFDGDGVDDIAVSVAGGIRLFKGAAR